MLNNLRINLPDVKYPEYTSEHLIELIKYIYEKVSLIFSIDERRVLLLSLVFFYLGKNDKLPHNAKTLISSVRKVFFDKGLNTQIYNDPSPVKS